MNDMGNSYNRKRSPLSLLTQTAFSGENGNLSTSANLLSLRDISLKKGITFCRFATFPPVGEFPKALCALGEPLNVYPTLFNVRPSMPMQLAFIEQLGVIPLSECFIDGYGYGV